MLTRISRAHNSFTKQSLRKIYLKKRIDEISRSSPLFYSNMKQNLESLVRLNNQKQVNTIGSYIFSVGKEIIPPLLQGFKQAFPFFESKHGNKIASLMQFKEHHFNSRYAKQVYGIKIPEKSLPTVYPEMVLVPLMCFNPHSKQRLGYGGGYYDQYILHCRQQKINTIFVGIGFECLKQPSNFSSQNDQTLDYVITEKTIY